MRHRLTEAASRDLVGIHDHIAVEHPDHARQAVLDIANTFRRLESYPHVGRERPEFGAGVRSVVRGVHVIYYLVVDDGVLILRVLHGARDADAIFGRERDDDDPGAYLSD